MAKGPGKNNRIGITLKQLFELFPTEEAAEAWFAKLLWNDEPFLPSLWLLQRPGRHQASPNDAPLPRLSEAAHVHA